jgi:hypothetical protein
LGVSGGLGKTMRVAPQPDLTPITNKEILFMKKVVLIATALALCPLSFAQTPDAVASAQKQAAAILAQKSAAAATIKSLATSTCSFTFTSGTGNSFLKYCVTANGNITQFETPAGVEHIAIGSFGEGYGFCDLNFGVAYDDYADFGDSGNWLNATVASSSPTSVKIVRTTADGIWTLTQTIAQVASTGSAKITMPLKNNTAIDRSVELVRYADVDADDSVFNNFDSTFNSAFGWDPSGTTDNFGMMLQDVNTTAFTHLGLVQNVAFGPDPCHVFRNVVSGTQIGVDGSVLLSYVIEIPPRASRTVTVSYKGM